MKKIFYPDIILIFIILQVLFHFIFPIKQIVSGSWIYVGIPLIILGQIPNFWIYSHFKRLKTTLNINEVPNKLTTLGLFKISRNPNYLGMAITLLGVAVLFGSLITFIFPLAFVILTDLFVIPIEEKNLEKKFGKKYDTYKLKVGRWI